MECALSMGVMEIGLVASVRPVAAALLAAACVRDTGAAAPAWDVVGEVALPPAAPVVVAGELGAPGLALGALAEEGQGAPCPARGAGDRGPALNGAGGGVGGSGAPRASGGVPACTILAPGIGAVRSLSSRRNSKAEDAIGEVDMSAKGKKDSSKTTCLEVMMRFDPSSRHR